MTARGTRLATTVISLFPATACPSGFVIVIDFRPGVAAVVFNESATWETRCVVGLAGMMMLALLTVMLPSQSR